MSDATSTPPQKNTETDGNAPPSESAATAKHGDVALVYPTRLEERLSQGLRRFVRPDQIKDLKFQVSQAVVQTSTVFHQGPLPAPQQFQEYESILPGSADRILAMAENEQNHRHGWEDRHLTWDGVTNITGLTFGWLLSIALAAGAVYCATINQPWVAGALTGFSAFGGVASLIRGRKLFGKSDHGSSATESTEVATQSHPAGGKKKNKKHR